MSTLDNSSNTEIDSSITVDQMEHLLYDKDTSQNMMEQHPDNKSLGDKMNEELAVAKHKLHEAEAAISNKADAVKQKIVNTEHQAKDKINQQKQIYQQRKQEHQQQHINNEGLNPIAASKDDDDDEVHVAGVPDTASGFDHLKDDLHAGGELISSKLSSLQSAAAKQWESDKRSIQHLSDVVTEQTKDSLHELNDRIQHNKEALKDRVESLSNSVSSSLPSISTTTTTEPTHTNLSTTTLPAFLPPPSADVSRVPSIGGGYGGLHLNDENASMADGARLAAMVQDQSEL